jgi:hypothetical protein
MFKFDHLAPISTLCTYFTVIFTVPKTLNTFLLIDFPIYCPFPL